MQKKRVFKIGTSVCFSEFIDEHETPEIGKIVAYLPEKNPTAPYLIDLSQTARTMPRDSIETGRWTAPDFMREYSEKFYRRLVRYIDLFSRTRGKSRAYFSLRSELTKLYRDGHRSFFLHYWASALSFTAKNILHFVGNVLVQGTLWLLFGSVVRLYQNFYQKYEILRQSRFAQFRLRSASDEKTRAQARLDIAELQTRNDKLQESISSTTSNLLAFLFSIASLIIAVLGLKK